MHRRRVWGQTWRCVPNLATEPQQVLRKTVPGAKDVADPGPKYGTVCQIEQPSLNRFCEETFRDHKTSPAAKIPLGDFQRMACSDPRLVTVLEGGLVSASGEACFGDAAVPV